MSNESFATNQLNSTEFKRQPSTFLNYIHNFRGLAILFIVAGHINLSFDWNNYQSGKIANILLSNGTVFFVFIAGFLFQFLSKKYEYKKYISKKIQYVIVPYLIVSIPGLIWAFSKPFLIPEWFKEDFSGWPIWGQVIMCLLTGAHFFHLWFIPMIAIFYIISPVLIWLDKYPRFYWLLPLLIIVTLIIPRPDFNRDIFQSFIHFFSIYVTGMFCSHFREKLFPFMKRSYIFLICTFIALTALEYFWMPLPNNYNENSVNSVSKLIFSMLLIYFLWLNEPRLPKILERSMGLLAEFSFGIYFLHAYFIVGYSSVEKKLGLTSLLSQANPLAFTMNFALSVAGSMIVIVIVKKIFGKNSRWIIGC